MNALEARIDELLAVPPYSLSPEDREPSFLALLKDELEYACSRSAAYRNYVRHWPVDPRAAPCVADLPYLPVSLLKVDPPFALVEAREIKKLWPPAPPPVKFPAALPSTRRPRAA